MHTPHICHTAEGLLEGQSMICAKQLSTREEGNVRNSSLKSHTTAMESGPQFCLHTCCPTIKSLHVVGHVLLYLERNPRTDTNLPK